jgi:hypothetical protein
MRFIFSLIVFFAVLASAPPGTATTLEDAERAFENRDYKQACQLYLPLAEQGVPEAMVRVAEIYEYGWLADSKSHDFEALQWYLKAARHGNADGAFGAAQMYRIGRNADQDYKAAANLYQQAAEAGNAEAAAWLGQLYFQGQGVEKDLEQAGAWLNIGAEKSSRARLLLKALIKRGLLAPDGTVINKSDESAVKAEGATRQTLTAVRGKSPADIKVQAKSAEQAEQKAPPEAWVMIISGLAVMFFAFIAFRFPELFMDGRRSFFWKDLIGERATAIMIRVISTLVGIAGILVTILGVIIFIKG